MMCINTYSLRVTCENDMKVPKYIGQGLGGDNKIPQF